MRCEKIISSINNMSNSLKLEYGTFEDEYKFKKSVEYHKQIKETVEKRIMKYLPFLFSEETKKLLRIKGLSYILIAKFLAFIIDIERFPSPANLKSYAGITPGKGKQEGKSHSYSLGLQVVMLGRHHIVDGLIIWRTEPYRSIYDTYKTRLHKERPDETDGHIDNMARRKIADKFLEDIWYLLRKDKVNRKSYQKI